MKDLKFYIGIASFFLVAYLVAMYNQPKPINWAPTFVNSDKIPYGTYIPYTRLHDIFPGANVEVYQEPVYNVINDYNIKHGTYIIICKKINLNEEDYNKLTGFIKKGNDVLIAASTFGQYFNKTLKIETDDELDTQKTTKLKFLNKMLDTNRTYTIDKNMVSSYFSNIDTTKAILLGKNNLNHIDFIRYSFGKGNLYLHANPLMFTNYSLLNQQGAMYAATALSYLKNDKNLIWDEYYTAGRDQEDTPMRVFLRNNALRGAYYIALFSLLLFIVYEAKRRQRIIPIIEPLKNTTVDFVNTVGQVYYEQRNNSNIAQKKAAYFLENIRTGYHLKTSVLNDEFLETLSHKSGVDTLLIKELINQITLARTGLYFSDADLITLNKNIEQFYLKSR